jgi:hypothetical protein
MDMIAGRLGWRNVAAGACLLVIGAAYGCTQETRPIGSPEVHFREERLRTVASARIMRDGEEVGSIRTLVVNRGRGDRVVHQVKDRYLNALGYIDENNCAYRITAYSGAEFVASSSDRRRNVAAILGAYGSQIELIEEEPAAALER